MKLISNSKTNKDKNGENLKIPDVVLVYCNIVNNNYQQHLRVLDTFISTKLFGQLQDTSPKKFIFLNAFFFLI